MPVEGLGGDVEDVFLQVFQRFDAEDLFAGFGIADHEVAEAEVVDDGLAEVYGKFFEFLSMNVPPSSITSWAFSFSELSMIIGR